MRHLGLGIGTALGAGALVVGGIVTAPAAGAVDPTSATISFDCGSYGSGTATLTASQDGTSATIDISTDAVTSPLPIAADSVASVLTLTDESGGTVEFNGHSNPSLPAGKPISTGPMTGTVAAGQQLSASSLKVTVLGLTGNCKATSEQSPGPFTF